MHWTHGNWQLAIGMPLCTTHVLISIGRGQHSSVHQLVLKGGEETQNWRFLVPCRLLSALSLADTNDSMTAFKTKLIFCIIWFSCCSRYHLALLVEEGVRELSSLGICYNLCIFVGKYIGKFLKSEITSDCFGHWHFQISNGDTFLIKKNICLLQITSGVR